MKEFDPRSAHQDVYQVAAWLRRSGAVLGVIENFDLAADRLEVYDFNAGGYWRVPLAGDLHFIDDADRDHALEHPATLWVTGMSDDKPADILVLHTGADDEPREVKVDLDAPISFVSSD